MEPKQLPPELTHKKFVAVTDNRSRHTMELINLRKEDGGQLSSRELSGQSNKVGVLSRPVNNHPDHHFSIRIRKARINPLTSLATWGQEKAVVKRVKVPLFPE